MKTMKFLSICKVAISLLLNLPLQPALSQPFFQVIRVWIAHDAQGISIAVADGALNPPALLIARPNRQKP